MQAAEDRIRSLKASGTATQAEVRLAVLEFAAARIRHLKAQNAPQEEVRAAVQKLIAHEAIPFEGEGQIARGEGKSEYLGGDFGADAEVYAAEKRIRTLKASASSSQADVRRAILDYAEARVRSAKARGASQEEVKSAVNQLLALEKAPFVAGAVAPAVVPRSTTQHASASGSEFKHAAAGSETQAVQAAETRVRSLKEKGAPQADVRRAVLDYAEARVRYLKSINAPQAEVKQAVEKLLAVEALPLQ